jgi:translation initiation factor 3 subunit B
MENGYHIYDFKGEALREEPVEKFKQFAWRPRPPTLLSKDEQKQIRKNLREYSRVFEQEDADRGASADLAVVEARRRVLDEWHAWRAEIEAEVVEEREVLGLPLDPHAALLEAKTKEMEGTEGGSIESDRVIEEIVEDVLEESEEVIG